MAGAGWSKKQVKKRLHNHPKQQPKASLPILEIPDSINVLVRPGQYEVTEAIGISTLRRTTQVRIKRMEVPKGRVYCHSDQVDVEASLETKHSDEQATEVFENDVIIESKTKRRNEPLIRVFRGQLVLDRIKLEHYSPGIDIWNGNAAIQVQPASDVGPIPFVVPTLPEASAVLNRVDVRSYSGRGIVAVEGGHVYMEDCHVHHCAGTFTLCRSFRNSIHKPNNCLTHLFYFLFENSNWRLHWRKWSQGDCQVDGCRFQRTRQSAGWWYCSWTLGFVR